MTTLLCPECLRNGERAEAIGSPLPLSRPDPTYRCANGHGFDYPAVDGPDVEKARRERIKEVLPHPAEQAASGDEG